MEKYEQGKVAETLRIEVSSWSSKTQDFINRYHDRNAYDAATEALEHLESLLPALEAFGDISPAVTSTIKQAKDNIKKVNDNMLKAKLKFESAPLREKVYSVQSKLDVRLFSVSYMTWMKLNPKLMT